MTDSKNKKMISGEMLVGQIVNEYPQAVEILMEVGMHCLGCPSAQVERLEDEQANLGVQERYLKILEDFIASTPA